MDIVLYFLSYSTPRKYFREKLSGIYRYASKAGWIVQVADASGSADDIAHIIEYWQPVGCIVGHYMPMDERRAKLFRRIPTVFLDLDPRPFLPNCPSVMNDATATVAPAIEELFAANPASCAYVEDLGNSIWSRQRRAVFASRCRERNLPFASFSWARKSAAPQQQRELVRFLLDRPRPCGILVMNDETAQMLYPAIREAHLDIGADLQIVSIDNDELACDNLEPGLSSVQLDFELAGYTAAELLGNLLSGRKDRRRRHSYGAQKLIRRSSSRKIKVRGKHLVRILDYLDAHVFDSRLCIDDIARAAGCSRRLADLRFRESMGHSILEEIQGRRIDRARELLADRHHPISSIAAAVGYTSAASFKRLFKRRTGKTLRQWRDDR